MRLPVIEPSGGKGGIDESLNFQIGPWPDVIHDRGSEAAQRPKHLFPIVERSIEHCPHTHPGYPIRTATQSRVYDQCIRRARHEVAVETQRLGRERVEDAAAEGPIEIMILGAVDR